MGHGCAAWRDGPQVEGGAPAQLLELGLQRVNMVAYDLIHSLG